MVTWRLPYGDINLYLATLEKDLREVEEHAKNYWPCYAHIILLYNPEKDVYEVWKAITP